MKQKKEVFIFTDLDGSLLNNETWRDFINPTTKINGKNSIRLKPFETL